MRTLVHRAALVAASCAVTAALAQQPAPALDAAQVERRLANVETLIERSSGAQQIEASGNAAAKEKREAARAKHREAAAAFKAGDLKKAAELLPQASTQMFEAVRLASPEQVNDAKRRGDFAAKMESARALQAAQNRIAAEKKAPGSAETSQAIEKFLAQADSEAAAGRMEAANASLEQGYLLAKAAIGSMRSGDTLVRSLNFASPKEEYAYELDRNDTHKMLLKMLLDQSKAASAGPAIARSAELRNQAESSARTSDYTNATRLLEESTRELVKAIRAAGVYIPG
jgi:hypothetical protein